MTLAQLQQCVPEDVVAELPVGRGGRVKKPDLLAFLMARPELCEAVLKHHHELHCQLEF